MDTKTAHSSPSPMLKDFEEGDVLCLPLTNLSLEICRIGSSVYVSVLPREGSGFSPLASMEITQKDRIIIALSSDMVPVGDRMVEQEIYKVYASVPRVQM